MCDGMDVAAVAEAAVSVGWLGYRADGWDQTRAESRKPRTRTTGTGMALVLLLLLAHTA